MLLHVRYTSYWLPVCLIFMIRKVNSLVYVRMMIAAVSNVRQCSYEFLLCVHMNAHCWWKLINSASNFFNARQDARMRVNWNLESHGNTSMYVDTVINLVKLTTYIHTHATYVQNEWSHSLFLNNEVQARQNYTFCRRYYKENKMSKITKSLILKGLLYWLPKAF